jgi:cytochrome b
VAGGRANAPSARGGRIRVWDAAVRTFHAALAALVVFDLIADDGGPVHRAVGYVAVALVVARLSWAALARGENAFAALKPSLRRTIAYLRAGAPRTVGHDPLGVWMVWLLWSLVLLLGVTGWMSRLDAFWGDDRVHAVHAWLADALLAAVALHLAGVAAMSWRWRENLSRAIVTGTKRVADPPR